MKIDLQSIDRDNFMVHPHVIVGEVCYLVQPKFIGAKWTRDNLHFRSSVWNSDGELISASFKKFFNWDEQPDLAYKPFSLTANGGCQLIEKIDGSTLIVSKYKGELIIRTRGTVDATKLDNGYEIEGLLKSNDGIQKFFDMNPVPEVSLLFEWTSPANKIVLNYGEEPCLVLIGVINHKDYSLWPQDELDVFSIIAHFRRPRTFQFNSIQEMIDAVEALKGQEGICCYCNGGQDIRKIKSAWYLSLHRMKSELGSIDKVIDFYFILNRPDYQTFYSHIEKNFDYELAEQSKGHISRICDGMKEVNKLVAYMTEFVKPLMLVSRKEAAEKIIQAYGNTNRSGFAFTLLSGRLLKDEDYKKLLYQVIKD
jgi:hypothetical protein